MAVWARKYGARNLLHYLTINLILMNHQEELFSETLSSMRRFRHRLFPLQEYTPQEVKRHYRFFPETILYITRKLYVFLRRRTNRSNPIPPVIQVLIALDVIAHGSPAHAVACRYAVGKSSVDRIVKRFCQAVRVGLAQEMRWPSEAAQRDIKESFHRIAGIPGVVGLVDGMLVRIRKPSTNSFDYLCRKSYYALNCVVCAGPDNIIYAANTSWPGSVHDARALDGSGIRGQMRSMEDGHLLGDNGYPLKPWLMTPVLRPQTAAERRYNSAHSRTRVRIEHTFGILKARFAVLAKGTSSRDPKHASDIMATCFYLHNLATRLRDHISPLARYSITDGQGTPNAGRLDNADGQRCRARLIQNYFGKKTDTYLEIYDDNIFKLCL